MNSDNIWRKEKPKVSGYYLCYCADEEIRLLVYKDGVFYKDEENDVFYDKENIKGWIYIPDPKLLDTKYDIEITTLRNIAYLNNMNYTKFSELVFGYDTRRFIYKRLSNKMKNKVKKKLKELKLRTKL